MYLFFIFFFLFLCVRVESNLCAILPTSMLDTQRCIYVRLLLTVLNEHIFSFFLTNHWWHNNNEIVIRNSYRRILTILSNFFSFSIGTQYAYNASTSTYLRRYQFWRKLVRGVSSRETIISSFLSPCPFLTVIQTRDN